MSYSIILPANHYFLRCAQDVDNILQPLKRFGINTFSFMRNYLDGKQIFISSKANWTEDYYKYSLYGNYISQPPDQYTNGYLIWPFNSHNPVFQLPRERHDSDHGIVLVRTNKNFSDYYFFSASTKHTHMVNFYINNNDILDRFLLYFQDRAETLLKNSEKYAVNIPKRYLTHSAIDETRTYITDPTAIKYSLHEMRIRKYRIKSHGYKNIKLSAREIECILHYKVGKTAKQTGNAMNISQRTVETYFDNIKRKLNCYSKDEIIQFLINDGFLD